MQASVKTVSFVGISTIQIDVQLQMSNGIPNFTIVGLPDKTVAESKERIRACLFSMGISLPAKRITVNLAPADVPKEGSHYDLPIAIALLAAMEIIPKDDITNIIAIGELSLSGEIAKVPGCLPAAVCANENGKVLICSADCVQEALWSGSDNILSPTSLLSLINHFNGTQILHKHKRITIDGEAFSASSYGCLSDVKGQMVTKRALEIAAAGTHNMLMVGPPGVGKSLLSSRISSILPPFTPEEALEVTMIHSLAGKISESGLVTKRPYRAPHHSASIVAIVGGGIRAQPGEISLAHRGVLFLDELPEFSRSALESLRQPLETGDITIARANNHVTYPAKIQLIAAMNPCKCGYLGVDGKECHQAPRCGSEYMKRISGPLLDRIDIFVDVPDVKIADFTQNKDMIETSETVRKRVILARAIQLKRYQESKVRTNSEANGADLEHFMQDTTKNLLYKCVEKAKISARGYYRIVKLARTIADLSASDSVNDEHVLEALSYRKINI